MESSGLIKDMISNSQVQNLLEILNEPAENLINESLASLHRLEEIFAKRDTKIQSLGGGLTKALVCLHLRYYLRCLGRIFQDGIGFK